MNNRPTGKIPASWRRQQPVVLSGDNGSPAYPPFPRANYPYGPVAYLPPQYAAIDPETQPLSMGQALAPLRRNWLPLTLLTVVGSMAALLIALHQTPMYRSVSQLEIEGFNEDFLDLKGLSSITNDHAIDPYLQTQIRVLESQELLARVAKKLDLAHRPEYATSSKFTQSALTPEQRVLRILSDRVSARVAGTSHVIDITAESDDPAFAALLANEIATEYIDLSQERRLQTSDNLSHSLGSQLDDLKASLDRSEQALQKYANGAGLVDLSETNPNGVAAANLHLAQEAAAKARNERMDEQARYERTLAAPADTLPEVLDDPTLRGYIEKLADLRRQDAELSATLKPTHYKVQEVRAQITALTSEVEQAKGRILARIKNQFDSARQREQLEAAAFQLETELAASGASKSIHYATLKRDVDTNRQLYESMLEKTKEASVASAVRATNAQVLSAATTPTSPAKPVVPLYGTCGAVAGLCCGFVVAFLRPRPPVRKLTDFSLEFGIPQLTEIPHAAAAAVPMIWRAGICGEGSAQETPADGAGLDHSIRGALAAVTMSTPVGTTPKVLVVTSANDGEGKTTVAANLAAELARTGQRVLLIDAHLRRPRQHHLFGLPNHGGFTDLLENITPRPRQRAPQNYVASAVPCLSLMPAGEGGDAIASRLYSPGWAWMMASIRQEFDAVVIDAPPVTDLSSRPLARSADGVLIVIAPRKSSPRDVLFAIERLTSDGAHVLGTVINHFDPRKSAASEASTALLPAMENAAG